MIKVEEVRIDNWLLDINKRKVVVWGIPSHQNTLFLNYANGAGIYENYTHNIEPIPLTEEILLKAGFSTVLLDESNPGEGVYYTKSLNENKHCDLAIMNGDKNGVVEACLFPYNDDFRYKYLHQLQNLYFALTGEELMVNL